MTLILPAIRLFSRPRYAFPITGARRNGQNQMRKVATNTSVVVVAVAVVVFAGTWLTSSATGIIPTAPANPVYSGSRAISVPAALSTAKYGTGSDGTVTLQSPGWSPQAQSAGSVTTPGDIALVDATGAAKGLHVSVFVTNLSALQQDYSSFVLPVDVYYLASSASTQAAPYLTTSSCNPGSCSWQLANGAGSSPAVSSSVTYLTSDEGMVSFTLPRGFYDITLEAGGSYYCTNTTAGSLSPTFFVTSKPA